jgi:hypothetical protein
MVKRPPLSGNGIFTVYNYLSAYVDNAAHDFVPFDIVPPATPPPDKYRITDGLVPQRLLQHPELNPANCGLLLPTGVESIDQDPAGHREATRCYAHRMLKWMELSAGRSIGDPVLVTAAGVDYHIPRLYDRDAVDPYSEHVAELVDFGIPGVTSQSRMALGLGIKDPLPDRVAVPPALANDANWLADLCEWHAEGKVTDLVFTSMVARLATVIQMRFYEGWMAAGFDQTVNRSREKLKSSIGQMCTASGRERIIDALNRAENVTEAAELLKCKKTKLYNDMKRYGIDNPAKGRK